MRKHKKTPDEAEVYSRAARLIIGTLIFIIGLALVYLFMQH